MTSEDVANSLYYVHLLLPIEEAPLSPPPPRNPDSPRSSLDSVHSANRIRRKPVPASSSAGPTSASPSDALPPSDWPAGDHGRGWNSSNPRVEGDMRQMQDAPSLPPRPTVPPSVPRKPLGPRPMTPSKLSAASERPPGFNAGLDTPPPAAVYPQTFGSENLPQPRAFDRSPSPSKRKEFIPFSLSLIRRDPSSGHQWNVGRVSAYQRDSAGQEEQHLQESYMTAEHPINISLETSGYAKFRGIPTRQGGALGASSSSLPRSLSASVEDAQFSQIEGGFHRQVVMTYRQSWKSNLKDKFRRSENSQSPPSAPPPTMKHTRQESNLSVGSADSSGSGGEPAVVITQPGHGLKPQGYMFSSPWDGRCEFQTGNAGRSVKCRHVLEKASGVVNPLVPSSQGRHGSIITGSAPVSELRFNLPSTDLFKSKEAQLHGHFSKLLRLEHHETESEEEEEPPSPFDLPLGKEKAGGGNRGKRAKLGKLIVQHDGLKMLDLVVAANIGLWWRAWERSF